MNLPIPNSNMCQRQTIGSYPVSVIFFQKDLMRIDEEVHAFGNSLPYLVLPVLPTIPDFACLMDDGEIKNIGTPFVIDLRLP